MEWKFLSYGHVGGALSIPSWYQSHSSEALHNILVTSFCCNALRFNSEIEQFCASSIEKNTERGSKMVPSSTYAQHRLHSFLSILSNQLEQSSLKNISVQSNLVERPSSDIRVGHAELVHYEHQFTLNRPCCIFFTIGSNHTRKKKGGQLARAAVLQGNRLQKRGSRPK